MPTWQYDPGHMRFKHKWARTHAGFIEQEGRLVGKCPNSFDMATAEDLLNTGVPWFNPKLDQTHPKAIFNLFEGVVYKATVTEPGKSYHGYPWKGPVPKKILTELGKIAEAKDCRREFDQWAKEHLSA